MDDDGRVAFYRRMLEQAKRRRDSAATRALRAHWQERVEEWREALEWAEAAEIAAVVRA